MSTSGPRALPHVLTTAALGALLALGAAAPAVAAPAPPQLSISVDDGQPEARSGTTLRYTVTVTNLGGTRVRDLVVSQTVPASTKLRDVGGGDAAKDTVRWTADVPAGKSVRLRTSVEVGEDLPADLLRLATVACAATSAKAAPTVCASDSDQLPAGAAVAEQQRDPEAAVAAGRPAWWPSAGALAGVVGLGIVVALVLLLTRGSRTRGPAGRRTDAGSGETSHDTEPTQDRSPARSAP